MGLIHFDLQISHPPKNHFILDASGSLVEIVGRDRGLGSWVGVAEREQTPSPPKDVGNIRESTGTHGNIREHNEDFMIYYI